MMRVLLKFVFCLTFFVWANYFANENMRPELYGISIGIVAALLIELGTFLYKERAFLRLYWACWFKPFQNPNLRLTISYLYNIEVQGRYLLVKSRRIDNTYQPVGGVYKYFHPEATTDLIKMGAISDNAIPNDDVSESDLRLKLRNRKNLFKFLKWFFDSKERERDPWREFYEELVVSGILSENDFHYIHYELIGEHFEPIHFDTHFKVDTFKYADIYTPKFVSDRQKDAIKKLRTTSGLEFIWATEDEIMNKVTTDGKRIADHTYKIFYANKLHK